MNNLFGFCNLDQDLTVIPHTTQLLISDAPPVMAVTPTDTVTYYTVLLPQCQTD